MIYRSAIEWVARALFKRDVEEDVCDGTWEENAALHPRILADAEAALAALGEYILPCDVSLPNTTIRAGCKLSTLMLAIKLQEP